MTALDWILIYTFSGFAVYGFCVAVAKLYKWYVGSRPTTVEVTELTNPENLPVVWEHIPALTKGWWWKLGLLIALFILAVWLRDPW